MKLLSVLYLLIVPVLAFGQSADDFFNQSFNADRNLLSKELKYKMGRYDFARIWTATGNESVYGFIGDEHQRIRVKFIKVSKLDGDHYKVYGKSMVKNNVCDFNGELIINSIRQHKVTHYGVDDELKGKGILGEYTINGSYKFSENPALNHSGIFKGNFRTEFYLAKGDKIYYDDINIASDGYNNNQFTGVWINYKTHAAQVCNWGDYRIPQSGDLDIGAGDFSPADKYLSHGWQTVRDAYNNGHNKAAALAEEKRHWWE